MEQVHYNNKIPEFEYTTRKTDVTESCSCETQMYYRKLNVTFLGICNYIFRHFQRKISTSESRLMSMPGSLENLCV
jgi:hypothetical protein